MPLWVWIVIAAALMQTVRTGLQKALKQHLSTHAINWVRYGFGLPPALLYLFVLQQWGYGLPTVNLTFFLYCILAAFFQIIATHLLILLFSHRNFAIGTTYAKTEGIQTALIGLLFFGVHLTPMVTVAVIIGVIAVMLISFAEETIRLTSFVKGLTQKTARIGLACGASFALCALYIREAALALESQAFLMNAAATLVVVMLIQCIFLGGWMLYTEKGALHTICNHWKPSALVGITSTLGSIGWFTALAMTEAAHVKTVGQIEILFALIATHSIFKERVRILEWLGIILLVLSILLLIYAV